jgi:hypothetical protein
VIATAAGGRYFELDRDSDTDIANAIISATRTQSSENAASEGTEELYPQCLLAAAGLLFLAAAARM